MSGEVDQKMHPYFTEIPLQSFEAMAFEGNLSEVLLALIVDPHEAEDVALTILDTYDTRIEIASEGGFLDAPVTLKDFLDIPSKHKFEQMKITLSQWVMTTKDAADALRTLTKWERRFGVWCACRVVRDVIYVFPEDEHRPRMALATAEAWVIGKATSQQAKSEVRGAEYASGYFSYRTKSDGKTISRARSDAASAAACAANAAASASRASAYAARASEYAANVAAGYNEEYIASYSSNASIWISARAAELVRLRDVVANACLTFPG